MQFVSTVIGCYIGIRYTSERRRSLLQMMHDRNHFRLYGNFNYGLQPTVKGKWSLWDGEYQSNSVGMPISAEPE